MTRLTVVWSARSLAQLAEIWSVHFDRTVVARAADSVDRGLSNDADQKGEALHEGLRTLDTPPLHVIFSTSLDDRIARVVMVKAG